MASDRLNEQGWRQHYIDTLGFVPELIEDLYELDPQVAAGYTSIRERAYSEDGGLPRKYLELLYVVMDIELGNDRGTMYHLEAAARAGLTRQEFATTLIALVQVHGAAIWGLVGQKTWRAAQSIFEPSE